MQLGRYGSRAILNPTFLDFVTNKPVMRMDYANASTQEVSADAVYATGGDGAPRRISFFGNKQSTLTFETQIFTLKHLAMLAGRDITSGKQNIFASEVVAVEDNAGKKVVTLKKTPLNLQTISAFKYVNGILTDEVEVTALANNEIELTSVDLAVGDEIEVFYQFTSIKDGHKLSFTAKDFPKYVKIIGDTVYADEIASETEIVSGQLTYYKARLQPNFTLNFNPSGDPTSLSMVFDIFPVKVNGEDTLFDIVLYDE